MTGRKPEENETKKKQSTNAEREAIFKSREKIKSHENESKENTPFIFIVSMQNMCSVMLHFELDDFHSFYTKRILFTKCLCKCVYE